MIGEQIVQRLSGSAAPAQEIEVDALVGPELCRNESMLASDMNRRLNENRPMRNKDGLMFTCA